MRLSLAATTGVESALDVVKYLLAGADTVMSASALLRHGPEYAADLLDGLRGWMKASGFASLAEMRGRLAAAPGGDPARQERAGYVAALRAANRNTDGPW